MRVEHHNGSNTADMLAHIRTRKQKNGNSQRVRNVHQLRLLSLPLCKLPSQNKTKNELKKDGLEPLAESPFLQKIPKNGSSLEQSTVGFCNIMHLSKDLKGGQVVSTK